MNSYTTKSAPMSNDAYAGFLRLLLTPSNRVPAPSTEIDAYLDYLNAREPLSRATRRIIGRSHEQAA
jgi:hypothetical protein